MEQIQKSYAWREALELSKQLVRICEEFSDSDTNVVAWHIRQAVVDIPASVAMDLDAKRKATKEPVVKLMTELELVRRIYPAIDTTKADESLAKLVERMEGSSFAEYEPDPEEETEDEENQPVAETSGEADVQPAPSPAGGTVISPRVDGVKSPITSIDITGKD